MHSGLCDSRMWDGFAPLVSEQYEVVRHELRGYGDTPPPPAGSFSHADDLEAALDRPAVLIGSSFGGLLCLEVAARRPDLVTALVLIDALLLPHDFSEELEAYGAEEDRLYEAGDVDGVTDLNVEFWLGGAAPEVKEAVRVMQRRAVELQLAADSEPEEPGPIDLAGIDVPALVIEGDNDNADFRAIARRLATELPNATAATVEDATHLPALERPEETARLVLDFLR